jgi:hypothetical protein
MDLIVMWRDCRPLLNYGSSLPIEGKLVSLKFFDKLYQDR